MAEEKVGKQEMKDLVSLGWELFRSHMGEAILAYLILVLVAGSTCYILVGPLTCGFIIMMGKWIKKSEPAPKVSDVFSGFNMFLPSFLYCLILGTLFYVALLISSCTFILPIVLGLIYSAAQCWGLMLIVHRGMTPTDAFISTFSGPLKMPISVALIAGLVGMSGGLICGVGLFFTIPLMMCIYAVAFEQVAGNKSDPALVTDGTAA